MILTERHPWHLKGGERPQARHLCPEPKHAWPKPGAYWFDVTIDNNGSTSWIKCPDCEDGIPHTRAIVIAPEDHCRCRDCKAANNAPDCLKCVVCKKHALDKQEK